MRSVNVSAHRKVDEDEDIELDEDGEAQKDGVHKKARQAQSLVQGPFVQMHTKNLRLRKELEKEKQSGNT